MRLISWAALAAALLSSSAFAAEPTPPAVAKPKKWPGFVIASDDGAFKLRIGTQLQVDALFFPGDTSQAPAYIDGFSIRRFRPGLRATVFKCFDLRVLFDFAGSTAQVLDGVIETTHLDWLRLRVGKDKSPVSYDRLQSSTALLFLERGSTAALAPNRDLGVQLVGSVAEGVLEYQLGIFDGAADGGSVDVNADDQFDGQGRVSLRPLKTLGVKPLEQLVIGVSGSYGTVKGTATAPQLPRYQTPGRTPFFNYRAATTTEPVTPAAIADGERIRFGAHLDWRFGPVSLFGEYLSSSQEISRGDVSETITNSGYQAVASVVLTGENASWKGVEPEHNFCETGAGAFELALRVSSLSIDDAVFEDAVDFGSEGSQARGITSLGVSVNWYLNSAVKLQLNFERTSFDEGATDAGEVVDRDAENFLGARLQLTL